MKSSSRYLIVMDTETGGLPNSNQKAYYDVPLVEVAFVVIDEESLSVCEEVSMMFKRDYKEGLIYTAQAQEVHGITSEMQAQKGIELKEIFKKMVELFKKYKNPRNLCTLVGHNIVGYDNPFMKNFFDDMGDDIDKYVKFYLDTMQLAHMIYPEAPNYQLATCCQMEGIDLVNAHRAGADTYANALLMISYLKRMRGEGSANAGNIQQQFAPNPFRQTFSL